MNYLVVSGGVVSGLGKGVTSSSFGALLKEAGVAVTHIKIDPYLNLDAGTMSPYEHGEVYVLDDGGEADLDLGNYERFCGVTLTSDHNLTTGKIYQQVINRERKGSYLGKTVQVVPHVTDAIQEWIERVAQIPVTKDGKVPEVCIIELGGTVGDIESMVFLEALRQFRYRVGDDNFCQVHVSLVPNVGSGEGEPKSKPTQHGVKELRSAGLLPDMIVCRSKFPLDRKTTAKISLFCMVPATHVISIYDVANLYQVPSLLLKQKAIDFVLNKLRINKMAPERILTFENFSDRIENAVDKVKIGVVGKYTGGGDAYLSVVKALTHSCMEAQVKLDLVWIESSHLDEVHKLKKPEEYDAAWDNLRSMQGIVIPGGFGDRGVEGKIQACKYVRENNVPFLGICLGMQVQVIEYARNVLKLSEATSAEFEEESSTPIIVFMPEISTTHMGGTMRLGARPSKLEKDTLAYSLYGEEIIQARHRHRYEVNPEYVSKLSEVGLVFSGKDADKGVRMECTELPTSTHKFYFGCQFHPEYTSTPFQPSPPFRGLIHASIGRDLPVLSATPPKKRARY